MGPLAKAWEKSGTSLIFHPGAYGAWNFRKAGHDIFKPATELRTDIIHIIPDRSVCENNRRCGKNAKNDQQNRYFKRHTSPLSTLANQAPGMEFKIRSHIAKVCGNFMEICKALGDLLFIPRDHIVHILKQRIQTFGHL